jgi:hypothetical protein
MTEYSLIWWRRSDRERERQRGREFAVYATMETAERDAEVEAQHARKVIWTQLSRCEATTVDALARRLDLCEDLVRREIERMVKSNHVEAITPVQSAAAGGSTHYRLRRETDYDNRWVREVTVRLPISRMAQLRQWDPESKEKMPPPWIAAEASAYGV